MWWYTLTRHNSMSSSLIFVYPPLCCQNSPVIETWTPHRQCVNKRSHKSCQLGGGTSVDQTCLSSTSHRWLCELRSGEFGDHLRLVVVLLKQFLNHLCFMARRIILPMAVTAIREYCFPADQYSIPSSVYFLSEPGLFISAIWATAAKVWTTEPAFTSYVYQWALATLSLVLSVVSFDHFW